MRLKHTLSAIVLVLYFISPLAAGPVGDAVDAIAHGDYVKALRLTRPLANDGDAEAQYNLGLMYVSGRGVQQDYAAAAVMLGDTVETVLRRYAYLRWTDPGTLADKFSARHMKPRS